MDDGGLMIAHLQKQWGREHGGDFGCLRCSGPGSAGWSLHVVTGRPAYGALIGDAVTVRVVCNQCGRVEEVDVATAKAAMTREVTP